MTRRITGTFTDPCSGGVLSNIDIEFIAKQSSPTAGVPFGATCTFQTDGSGVYDQVIENGQYNIYYSQTENNRIKIGVAVVNDGADIDILNLIGLGGSFDPDFNLNLADLLDVDATNKVDGAGPIWRDSPGGHVYEAPALLDSPGNLTVGHTTDIDSIGEIAAAGTYPPNLALESVKRGTVAGSFTLARPTSSKANACYIELTITGAGGYTMSTTNIKILSGTFDGTAGVTNIIKMVHTDTATNATITIEQVP